MRVVLFHSHRSGAAVAADEIRATLEEHGHDLIGIAEKEAHPDAILADGPDLVAAAGGDGTVARAGRSIVGRGIPLAILPLGTANNIAAAVGSEGSIATLVRGWHRARREKFDVGIAGGPSGQQIFLEAVGGGLIVEGIARMQEHPYERSGDPPSRLERALRQFRQALARMEPRRWYLRIDGTPVTGEFLLVEILNIRSIGPNLVLSRHTSHADGLLTLVTADETHRDMIAAYLDDRIAGREVSLTLPALKGKQIEIEEGDTLHVDDQLQTARTTSIRIEPAALEVLV